ncbi:MAG: ABC transporter ATP-binding protein [Clostridiales bacterium]|nr:ABC transporter ATP-binding protein [Clostridiales bacterium]
MAENSIVIKDLTKKFKVYFDKGQSFKERILFRGRNRHEDRVVLDGISLTVKKGEAVGLIGHNGCGKSTLLKLMTRILYPDKGTIDVKGRVSSLIELGAGFHPDMSGRENIYTNASIFGLSKKEIDRRLDDIIAFSELEEFIDNPVRTYSSGMYMRLAFSVAINVNADVLLIDEILAVGDTNFQAKCFSKLQEIKAKGTTIVIVSHSLEQIEAFCDRTVWINDGKIVADGLPRDIHPEYLDYMGQLRNDQLKKEKAREEDSAKEESGEEETEEKEEDKKRFGNGDAKITNVKILDKDGEEKTVFHVGSKITIRVTFKVKKKIEDAVFGVGIFRNDGVYCYGTNTRIDRLPKFDIEKDGVLEIEMPVVDLLPGKYLVDLAIQSGNWVPVDYYKEACSFETYSKREDCGIVRINQTWHLPEDIRKE